MSEEDRSKVLGVSYADSIPTLGFVRKIYDPSSKSLMGLLHIELSLHKVLSFVEDFKLGKGGFVWIINEKGLIVSHPNRDWIGKPMPELIRNALAVNKMGHFTKMIDGKDQLFIFKPSSVTQWTLIAEIPSGELTEVLDRLRWITVFVVTLLIVVALIILGYFSYSLTRSLVQLQKLMKQAENGDLTVVSAVNRHHFEIASLNLSFNKMVHELNRLIEVQHQAELKEKDFEIRKRDSIVKVLQSQINPHFLYNTLEVINAHAVIAGAKPITRMTQALARMFRYNANHNKRVVTLYEEIENIKTYCMIYSERSPDFHLELACVEEDLLKVQAVPMMVQPLIENAMKHGYMEYKLKPTYLAISGVPEETFYRLRILDQGNGMLPEVMKLYNTAFSNNADEPESDISAESIGLWNVHQRLVYTFGHSFGLFIVSSNAEGTTIEVRLPYGIAEKGDEVDYV